MTEFHSKIFTLWLLFLGIAGSNAWAATPTPPPLITEETDDGEEELVAERHREEKPNLYDYNQQELRNEAEKNARRAYWYRPDLPPSDGTGYDYQYHRPHSAYEQ